MKQLLFNNVKRQRRRGSIAVLATVMLVVVIAFMAFSIDYGYIVVAESDLQNAADSGALSGARALKDGRADTITAAKAWAGKNVAAGENVVINDEDVQIGKWDEDTATFTPLPADLDESANAVRVTCRRTAGGGNPLTLFFAPAIGTDYADVQVSAIAAVNASCAVFVGIDSVNVIAGTYTDSYDSRRSTYNSQVPGDQGHVCSNHDISLFSPINGNASPGIGYDVTFQGNGSASGSTEPHAPKTYPPAEAGDAYFVNDNDQIPGSYWTNGKLTIANGRSVEFGGGTLYMTTLSINGELRITGPTVLYIEEQANVSGMGIVNTAQTPSDLKIILLDQSRRVCSFGGSSACYASIYGPGAQVSVNGQAGFFGGAIAGVLKLTNAGGNHADEALLYDLQLADAVKLVQ